MTASERKPLQVQLVRKHLDATPRKALSAFISALVDIFLGGWILMSVLRILVENGVAVPPLGYWDSFYMVVALYFFAIVVRSPRWYS